MDEILLSKDVRAAQVQLTSARRAFWSAAIVPCFAGSAVSFSTGLLVAFLSWSQIIVPSRRFAYVTIGLLFSAFVLMFLGAHCMDRRDAAEKAERLERSRREDVAVRQQ
jgi:hypothetical protein